MAVIKGYEKKLKKPTAALKPMSAKAKKKLRRPQDVQPIPTVGVS